jgi:hypothetical protein
MIQGWFRRRRAEGMLTLAVWLGLAQAAGAGGDAAGPARLSDASARQMTANFLRDSPGAGPRSCPPAGPELPTPLPDGGQVRRQDVLWAAPPPGLFDVHVRGWVQLSFQSFFAAGGRPVPR